MKKTNVMLFKEACQQMADTMPSDLKKAFGGDDVAKTLADAGQTIPVTIHLPKAIVNQVLNFAFKKDMTTEDLVADHFFMSFMSDDRNIGGPSTHEKAVLTILGYIDTKLNKSSVN